MRAVLSLAVVALLAVVLAGPLAEPASEPLVGTLTEALQNDQTLPFFNEEDMAWPGPERGCARVDGVGDFRLECALPAGKLTLSTDRASYLNIQCEPEGSEDAGRFECDELHEHTSAARLGAAVEPLLQSMSLTRCALPATLRCALALVGARDALTVVLRGVPTPLRPEHLADLTAVKHLRIVEAGPNVTRVPYEALAALPALKRFYLSGGALRLAEDWQPNLLHLEALELTQGDLVAIPPRAFYGLPQLRNLSLWENKIENLTNESLEGLPLLERLSLNANALKSLPPGFLLPTPRLKLLHLYGNTLSSLPSGLLSHLHNLEEVWLDNNNRTELRLEDATFAGLAALRTLRVERCGVRALPEGLLRGARALRELSLRGNRVARLPAALLADARALRALDLGRNALDALPSDVFLTLSSLRKLDLSNNLLTELHSRMFEGLALEELSLSHNRLTMEAQWAYEAGERYSPLSALRSLRRLALRGNAVRFIMDDWRTFVHLDALDLSYNAITNLTDVDLEFLGDTEVDVRHNNITVVGPFNDAVWELDVMSKAKFLLDYNPFVCDCMMYDFVVTLGNPETAKRFSVKNARCAAPPALAGTPLANVPRATLRCDLPPPACPTNCTCAHHPATVSLQLDCNSVPLTVPRPADYGANSVHLRLHSALADIAELPPEVRFVDLSRSGLTVAPAASATVDNLTIDLTDNKLTNVPVALLEANCNVRLAGNEIACDCKHRDEIAALERHLSRVDDRAALRCRDGEPVAGSPAARLCAMRDAIVLGGSLAAIGFVVAALVVLAYKYSTEIRLVLRKYSCLDFLFDDDDTGSEKTYDAFVSFSHHDDDFVRHELVRRLEGGRRPLKLCLHYRDWEIGGMIPEQIDRSVRESRRTIVVLSDDFLGSMWGREEFRAAHGLERVIVLLRGDVLRAANMDKELRAYLTTNTYVHADDPLVWERIRDAVRRTRARPRPAPAAPPAAPPADKLARSALDVQLRDGRLVNGHC